MRATLEEIQAEISAMEPDWPTRLETGSAARDLTLTVDGSNCSAIGHLYALKTQGNTLAVTTRHDGVHIIKPLKDAAVVAGAVIDFINRVEGHVVEED